METTCEPTVPTIQGTFIAGDQPDPTLLASFDGEDVCGTWKLHVVDTLERTPRRDGHFPTPRARRRSGLTLEKPGCAGSTFPAPWLPHSEASSASAT